MNNKVLINIIIMTVILTATLGLGIGGYYVHKHHSKEDETKLTDAEKFAEDYTLVDDENVFVYRDAKQIVNILKNGTGVVYLGFDECSWCQSYVVYLNEVAKEVGIEKIYYLDILEDRTEHTEEYQEILEIIGDQLQKDDEGNPRVYVPHVSFVINGKSIGYDYETSKDNKGIKTAEEYWSDESRVENLKTKFKTLMEQLVDEDCNICNI